MDPFAEVSCVLKVNVHCEACKMKILEVIGSIIGVYSVDIVGEEGLAKVRGEVDPNILLRALSRTGMHAEVAWVSLNHPMMSRSRSGSGYGDGHVPFRSYTAGQAPFNNYSGSYGNYGPSSSRNYRGGFPQHWSSHDNGNNNYYGHRQYYPPRRTMGDHHYQHHHQHHPFGASAYESYYNNYGSMPSYPYADDIRNSCNIM